MPDVPPAGQQAEAGGGARPAVRHGQGAHDRHLFDLTRRAIHEHASPVSATFPVTCSTTFHERERGRMLLSLPLVHDIAGGGGVLQGRHSCPPPCPWQNRQRLLQGHGPGVEAKARVSLYPRGPHGAAAGRMGDMQKTPQHMSIELP